MVEPAYLNIPYTYRETRDRNGQIVMVPDHATRTRALRRLVGRSRDRQRLRAKAEERARIEAAQAALAAQLRRGLKPPPGRLWAVDPAALLIFGPGGAIPASAAACAALAPLAVGGRHPEPAELRTALDGLAPRLAAVGLRVCRRKGGVRIARVRTTKAPPQSGRAFV